MKSDLMKECVDTLIALRTRTRNELDAGTAAELDEVICQLESCMKDTHEDAVVDAELRMRALKVIADVLEIATNIADIVRKYFGPE